MKNIQFILKTMMYINLWYGECDPEMYSLLSFDKYIQL